MTDPLQFLSRKDHEFAARTICDWNDWTTGGTRRNSASRGNRHYNAVAARWFLEGKDALQMIANEDYAKGKV